MIESGQPSTAEPSPVSPGGTSSGGVSSAPIASAKEAITLFDAFEFLQSGWKRHRRPAVLVALGVLGLTAAYIFLSPKKYRSEAQLYVRLGRESVTLDPTATTGETFNVNSTREHEINSVVEILSSPGNYEAVVAEYTPDVVLEKVAAVGNQSTGPATVGNRGTDADDTHTDGAHYVLFEPTRAIEPTHQLALTALKKQIGLEAVRRSNIVNASCVAGSPELAQELLSSYLRIAIERHMRASRPSGSFDFFQSQAADVDQQHTLLAKELSDLKSEVGVSSLDERRKTLQEQYSKIESDLATTEAELSEASGMVSGLKKLLETVPQTSVATTTGLPQDALGEAERQRNVLAIREQQLLSKYTANHPDVLALREQMRQANAMLDSNEGRKQALEGTNPTYVELATRMATEQAKVSGLTEKRNAYNLEREKAAERLTKLNSREGRIAALEERVSVMRKTRGDYATKLEQSRIDSELENERLSNITISQPATYEPKAVSPKRRVAAVVGFVLAMSLGLATLLFREFCDRQRGFEPIRLPDLPA